MTVSVTREPFAIRDVLMTIADSYPPFCVGDPVSPNDTTTADTFSSIVGSTDPYPFPRFPSLDPRHKRNFYKRRKREKQPPLHNLVTFTTMMQPAFSKLPKIKRRSKATRSTEKQSTNASTAPNGNNSSMQQADVASSITDSDDDDISDDTNSGEDSNNSDDDGDDDKEVTNSAGNTAT
jgi:hypothetical protein